MSKTKTIAGEPVPKNDDKSKKTTRLTFLQRLGLFFYDHREITTVFWIAILIFGSLCYGVLLKRQGFPNVDVPISVVSGTYFVDDANTVDSQVTRPASDAILKIDKVKQIEASAGANFYTIVVTYNDGVSSAEGNDAVKQALQSQSILPKSATAEFKAIDAGRFQEQSDLLLTVYATNNTDNQALEQAANKVAEQFSGLSSVQQVKLLKQFETGVNPTTGQPVTAQRSFDRVGLKDGSGQIFFYPAVTIGIQAKPSADALTLYDEVSKQISGVEKQFTNENLKLVVSADFAENIRSQISNLQTSLIEGLIAVLLISFLLISWRASLTIALSMITVLLLTVALLYATGNSLNTITLFALILSLGLIVDDTTIMVEAIDASRRQEARRRDVVMTAIKRVARASTTGTLTTMLAFAPMLFISGILGSFIRILPITIIIALAMSLIVSLTLVPFLAPLILGKPNPNPKPSRNPVLKVESWISGGLARMARVGKTSRWKGLLVASVAVLISLGFFLASLPLFGKLKFDIFPNTKDTDAIVLNLQFPPGTTVNEAKQVTDNALKVAGDVVGSNFRRLSLQSSGSSTAANATIDLVSYKQREEKSPQIVADTQKAFEGFQGATVKVSQLDVGPPKEEYPFKVQVYSEDQVKAEQAAQSMVTFLNGREVQRASGSKARITRAEIDSQDFVRRRDGKRYVEVRAGFDADDVSALVTVTQTAVEKEFTNERLVSYGLKTTDLKFDFGSESNNQESFKSMLIAFPLLLIVMFLVLAFQFKSFLQPILIFLAIPFSFFGVAAGLYATDNPLSFFVLVGFFALIGIALNNTILLVDYANQARKEGAERHDAISQAIRARFRPLITTSLTSVVALIPLALSDPFWEALAFTLIFGLLSSTFLVVVSFPYIYLIGEVIRGFGHKLWIRELWKPLQFVLDIFIWPIRLIAFAIAIGFRQVTG